YGRAGALVFSFSLDMEDWDVWPLASLVRFARPVQRGAESAERAGDRFDCRAHVDQYARAAPRQDCPKHFYSDQNRVARAVGSAGTLAQHCDRARGKLHGFLAQRRLVAQTSLP